MRTLMMVTSLAVLAGCGAKSEAFEKAKSVVSARLSDPNSAEFQNLVEVKPLALGSSPMPSDVALGRGVCGEVNAKNLMGGYIGFQPFVYLPDTRELFFSETTGVGGTLKNLATGKVMEGSRYDEYCTSTR